ncbi:double-stranded RNA-binding protein 4-like isoform X1 [Quercus robur]|uniref:double-stranded RNA-binding protein 4-like isoform X1 n=1 Tax=Quercus robur TaxID=38942 RepID=UPI002163EC81|nr:double-stranded RNA-binding protein 4-like isoform X1 [Quercus robur]
MYKSKLQELCQQKSWSLPEYVSTKDGPDHNPRFTATATVIINSNSPPQTFHSSNPCKSSKAAQNDAARVAFLHFTQPPPPPPPSITIRSNSSFASFPQPSLPSSSSFSGSTNGSTDLDIVSATRQAMQPKTQEIYQTPQVIGTTLHVNNDFRDMQHFYKNQLQNFAQKRNLLLPVYSCKCEGPPHASHFRCKVTVDGQTYESPEFFTTSKDAEHAAAKIALTSLVPDGAKEDNSGLYKNLLQELVQKEGFSLPVYNTNRFGEVHVPIFVSTVEIEGEVFKGHEERTKKKAEMNAAKIAYTTLKERKSGQGPLIVSPAHKGKETPEISSSSLQRNVTADLQQLVGATMNLNLCTIAERQAGKDRVSTEVSLNQPSILSSGPDTIITCNRGSSVDASYGYAPDTFVSTPCKSENGPSSHSSTNLVMDSSLVPPAETIISSCKRIFVHPHLPNMTVPKGYTILPKSDDKWVAFSPN